MGNAPTHKIDPNGTNARDMIIPASAGADDMNDFGGQLASKNDAILRDMFKFLGDVYGEGPGGGPAPGNGGRQGIILNPMGGYSFNGSPWLNVASIYSTAHISVEQSHESKSEQNYLIVESPSGNFINIPTGWLSNQVVLATLASLGVTYEADANIYVQQFIGGKPTVLITANDAVVANIQQSNGGSFTKNDYEVFNTLSEGSSAVSTAAEGLGLANGLTKGLGFFANIVGPYTSYKINNMDYKNGIIGKNRYEFRNWKIAFSSGISLYVSKGNPVAGYGAEKATGLLFDGIESAADYLNNWGNYIKNQMIFNIGNGGF